MTGNFGFSYTGLIFLCLLFFPNLLWTKNKPHGYHTEQENKLLLLFERTGEVLTSCCVLVFTDFNIIQWTAWSWWLVAAFVLMALYELWWLRYFRSNHELADFYKSLLGIPVAGATLPVAAFFLLGIYGRNIWLLLATILLGIGHIGIHLQHKKELNCETER